MLFSNNAIATNSIGMVECIKSGDICTFSDDSSNIDGKFMFEQPLKIYEKLHSGVVIGYVSASDKMEQLKYEAKVVSSNAEDIQLVETGYEVYSLPIYEMSSDKKWLKIDKGWISANDIQLGSQTKYVTWLEKLTSQMKENAFSLARKVEVKALPTEDSLTIATMGVDDGWDLSQDGIRDFDMHDPKAIQGNWARVKFYHYCGGEDEPPHCLLYTSDAADE